MDKHLTPKHDQKAQAAYARYRSQLYAAASEAFTTEPSALKLEALAKAAQSAQAGESSRASEQLLLEYLGKLDGTDFDALRTRVATEYAELFVGPRAPLAPLYESVYVGAVHRLNTNVTMQVRRFYEQCGMRVVKRDTVPNDHIGLELEFMAQLTAREADALESGDAGEASRLCSTQLDFLQNHLGAWVDAFASRVSGAYCADYYDAWGRFVQSFVSEQQAYLTDLSV